MCRHGYVPVPRMSECRLIYVLPSNQCLRSPSAGDSDTTKPGSDASHWLGQPVRPSRDHICGGLGASVHSRSGVTTGLDGPLVSRSRKATFAHAAQPRNLYPFFAKAYIP
ncbi:hypothetical protein DPMN_087828 [Dreissena polymorpha]|uniref:Uncharacterized protein n=1 Tax=Dreissena polymorpha TaxID=45954 RepID=A0A9D4FIA5_DREPO|nr:hypothetical protein DPMN_076814 [Dreissena polymorpha]KAH3780305.1 hypothetical protein DPMN_158118 [Dreissena polymorpha]KAH3780325.1 hypothetical protein DPMN_158138 [Dreissena polymorpha]KAH3798837.1 hypothetical protein DPMN_152440 [Dreissena polymorpha]KAH3845547.1 hypothetical protein DPMN_087828 [Dreissena polymorpha]